MSITMLSRVFTGLKKPGLKRAVSRYSEIFRAFLHEEKMATAHGSVSDITP